MSPRRLVAGVLFACILFGGFRGAFIGLVFGDREPLRQVLWSLPDRLTPDYPHFLADVGRGTRAGDRVAILVPMRHWNQGYAYAYYRASYFLVGREVIPLVDAEDRAHLERIAQADFLASWRTPLPPGRYRMVWRSRSGLLVRSVR